MFPAPSRRESLASDNAQRQSYYDRQEAAIEKWGRYGAKKRWLEANPGMTYADWQEYNQKRRER